MTYDTINDEVTQVGGSNMLLAGRYNLVRKLGTGGMGSVWLAEDRQLDNKLFALKMLPAILISNKRAYRQLKDEAIVAMKLVHPNIVQIRAFEEDNGNPFLVMDYVDGQTLDDYMAEYFNAKGGRAGVMRGGLPESDVIRILRPIAAALDYAHSKGVVHRDVKPGNVMIAKDGTPYILDFGIAREIQETLTRVTGKLSSGTLLYMSPEQLHGASPKPAQDIYSFAAMAYECLGGEPPFVRGQIEYQIDNDEPPPLPRGLRYCASAVIAGLAKKPENRPPTCVAVLDGKRPEGAHDTWRVTIVRDEPKKETPPPRLKSAENIGRMAGKVNAVQRPIPRGDWRYLPPDMRKSLQGQASVPVGKKRDEREKERHDVRLQGKDRNVAKAEADYSWKPFIVAVVVIGIAVIAGSWMYQEHQRQNVEREKSIERERAKREREEARHLAEAAIRSAAEKRRAKERQEQEARLARQKAEEERMAKERQEQEARLARQKAEEERMARERRELEKLLADQKAEEERVARERQEQEKRQKAEEGRKARERRELEELLAHQNAEEERREKLRAEAEKPKVYLTATLNGVPKPALITEGMLENNTHRTPLTVDVKLPIGAIGGFSVEYYENGVKYVGKGGYTVKKGLQNLEIALEREEFLRPKDLNFCPYCRFSLKGYDKIGAKCPSCGRYLPIPKY